MARTFVIGDIHGAHKALVQCLERSGFDKENDTLITLGDICDGWSEVYECVEELLTIRNRIDIKGNHDEPFRDFLHDGFHQWSWSQGGKGTLESYIRNYKGNESPAMVQRMGGITTSLNPMDVPIEHHQFFVHQNDFYIDAENRLFVHGGFNRHFPIREQNRDFFCWDRDLWMQALSFREMPVKKSPSGTPYKFKIHDNFTEIFIGHTATINWNTTEPMKAANIWNIDTGAGFKGKLTIMDVETKEYFQSDNVSELYADERGRN